MYYILVLTKYDLLYVEVKLALFYIKKKFSLQNLAGHNHCRNPDADRKPWCYVDSKGKFGFCPVPECTTEEVTMTTSPAGSKTTARPTTTTTG